MLTLTLTHITGHKKCHFIFSIALLNQRLFYNCCQAGNWINLQHKADELFASRAECFYTALWNVINVKLLIPVQVWQDVITQQHSPAVQVWQDVITQQQHSPAVQVWQDDITQQRHSITNDFDKRFNTISLTEHSLINNTTPLMLRLYDATKIWLFIIIKWIIN